MFKKNAQIYFNAFERKDINILRELFDSEVVLRDWDVEIIGVENILKANIEIFKTFQKIQVKTISLYADQATVIGELIITLDDSISIMVVDIIEFTTTGKIKSIRAFKG